MNPSERLQDLEARTRFVYDVKKTPVDNYIVFQQRITLANGAEFIADTSDQKNIILYLLGIPGLSMDLTKAEMQLKEFTTSIIDHMSAITAKGNNLFEIFGSFYELYRAVGFQQSLYHKGQDKYLGSATIHEYPVKELKKLKIPVIRSTYKGPFIQTIPLNHYSLDHNKLGSEIKNHLSVLYRLKRRYNINLLKELKEIGSIFFERKHIGNYYRYSGDKSDLVEIAIALVESGNLQRLSKEPVTANEFTGDLCRFLGLHFSKRSNYIPTIQAHMTQNKSFSKKIPGLVKQFLGKPPAK